MPLEFSLRHACDVNRKFGETLMYVCEVFARLAVGDAVGIQQKKSKVIRILCFIYGVTTITVVDFRLWSTDGLV